MGWGRSWIVAALVLFGQACSSTSSPVDSASPDRPPSLDARTERRGEARLDAALPDAKPKPPARWDPTGSLAQPRKRHSATLLQDGSVLVVGGFAYNSTSAKYEALTIAERYQPATGTWTSAGTTSGARHGHDAILLQDGRVLVVGGCAHVSATTCSDFGVTEIYDPKGSPSWSLASPLSQPRYSNRATLLQDGRVLVAGGYGLAAANLKSLEIFDPKTGFWSTPAATLPSSRNSPTLTLLESGKVLIAGGHDGDLDETQASLVVFDPKTGSLTTLSAKLAEGRMLHTGTRLADGRVLLAGGECYSAQNPSCKIVSAELYDPKLDSIATVGSAGADLRFHSATLLDDGRVLVIGGLQAPQLAQLFDPTQSNWQQTAPPAEPRSYHSAARLLDGRVLVVGGSSQASVGALSTAALYTP